MSSAVITVIELATWSTGVGIVVGLTTIGGKTCVVPCELSCARAAGNNATGRASPQTPAHKHSTISSHDTTFLRLRFAECEAHRVRPSPMRRTNEGNTQETARARRSTVKSRGRFLSRPSHRHCRHRCERPLRMDAPSTGWVTALAGLLARGSSSYGPAFPVSQWPRLDAKGSPLTVTGVATDYPLTIGARNFRVPSFVPGVTRGTSTLKCSPQWRI